MYGVGCKTLGTHSLLFQMQLITLYMNDSRWWKTPIRILKKIQVDWKNFWVTSGLAERLKIFLISSWVRTFSADIWIREIIAGHLKRWSKHSTVGLFQPSALVTVTNSRHRTTLSNSAENHAVNCSNQVTTARKLKQMWFSLKQKRKKWNHSIFRRTQFGGGFSWP